MRNWCEKQVGFGECEGKKKNASKFSFDHIMLLKLLIALTLAVANGTTALLAEKQLSLSEQLQQLQKEHAAMRTEMESYRKAVMEAGGPRKQKATSTVEETSFAQVDESTDDPTIQCQTICKFVRPAVAATGD